MAFCFQLYNISSPDESSVQISAFHFGIYPGYSMSNPESVESGISEFERMDEEELREKMGEGLPKFLGRKINPIGFIVPAESDINQGFQGESSSIL